MAGPVPSRLVGNLALPDWQSLALAAAV